MWCASYRQVLCRTSNGVFQFKQSSSPREPEILALDLAPRVSIFPEDDPLNHMGFQISSDALEAPIQFDNVFPVGLENIGIKVVGIRSEMRADGFVCSICYDPHRVLSIPEPFLAGCSSVTRNPTRQVTRDRVCVLLTLDGVGRNGFSMLGIVSFVEDTIDDRTAGAVPFDGRYTFAGHDPGKVRADIRQDPDDPVVFKYSFKERWYLSHS